MRIHKDPAIWRGIATSSRPRYCFVEFQRVEQDEPGDTLLHHFTFPGWFHCQRRWWVFNGTVGGNPSPSASPIMNAHFESFIKDESMRHIDLTHKEIAGVIDHADNSITPAKMWPGFYQPRVIRWDGQLLDPADKVDGGGGAVEERLAHSTIRSAVAAVSHARIEFHLYSTFGNVFDIDANMRFFHSPMSDTWQVLWYTLSFGGVDHNTSNSIRKHYGFIIDDDTLYASNADGVTQKKTNIGAITPAQKLDFTVVYRAGLQAAFYVNGVWQTTHDVNLPTGTNGRLIVSAYTRENAIKTILVGSLEFAGAR